MIFNSSSTKKIVAPLVLVAFLTLAFLSLTVTMRGSDGRMEGGCPFSAQGAYLCSGSSLASVIHHISQYNASMNVPVGSSAMGLALAVLSAALLIAVSVALLFSIRALLPGILAPARYAYPFSPQASFHPKKIVRWLSLFENSPSMA